MLALALLLPTLSLAALGTVWLWQHDLLLVWSGVATAVALMIYGIEFWLVRRGVEDLEARKVTEEPAQGGGESIAVGPEESVAIPPREIEARAAVEALAERIDPEELTSREAVLQLGTQTLRTVARSMHPGEKDPLWKFTVPEALVLVERVSGELNRFVTNAVPFGDRLTVGQLLTVYRWRGLATAAEKAYNLWRILRFVNPASAIAGEVRERVSGELIDGVRTEFTRRLARAYVREVGRAAIDLYSGRLRPEHSNAKAAEPPAAATAPAPAPLDILFIGQEGVGKSSLVNALSDDVRAAVDVIPSDEEFTTYELMRDEDLTLKLTESPALEGDRKRLAALVERACIADAIVWVLSATRPDRAVDVTTLTAIHEAQRARTSQRMPPVFAVLTGIDRVRPFGEWQPPYDMRDDASAKARNIRSACEAVAEDMALDIEDVVPVALPERARAYNVDLVWARLTDSFDQARNVQLIRRLSERRGGPTLKRLWRQATEGGRVLRRTVFD